MRCAWQEMKMYWRAEWATEQENLTGSGTVGENIYKRLKMKFEWVENLFEQLPYLHSLNEKLFFAMEVYKGW